MNIENEIKLLKIGRERLLDLISNQDMNYLLEIPKNFNNNIFWNVAHCVATQQLLQYFLSSTKMRIENYWIDHFRKGSFAKDVEPGERELLVLKEYLRQTPIWLEEDYEKEKFGVYQPYKTSFGVELKSIEEAIKFNNIHEGIHIGYVLALKKALQ